MKDDKGIVQQLLNTMPQVGSVVWIGVRPGRREPLVSVEVVSAEAERGLVGDRYRRRNGKRQVTLIQQEHLDVVASVMGIDAVPDGLTRRNIVVKGLNLLALKGHQFRIGDALFEYSGLCHPCSRMEEAFGPGGYNAMRGHGGITARVIESGDIRIGDDVTFIPDPD